MIFKECLLQGAYLIELSTIQDERGFFARSWCKDVFQEYGLNTNFVQCNISYNIKKGTLRGMHYQIAPYEEAKLIRCTSGSIYDVIIDLRPHSKTYLQWTAVVLDAKKRNMLYIPEGFAHGFQTLVDETEVFYQMSEFYKPDSARGIKWNDKLFNIEWPFSNDIIISDKDNAYLEYTYE